MPADSFDLTQPEFWMADPYPTLAWLRRNDPVHRHEVEGTQPFWAVSRHQDIAYVSKTPEVFCSGRGVGMVLVTGARPQAANMVEMDDPRHRFLRALVQSGFTPGAVGRLEAHVRELTTEILDTAAEIPAGEVDFVDDVASRLPSAVIGELLGMPREDQHLIKEWSDVITDPDPSATVADRMAARDAMFAYLGRMQEGRAGAPRDDLVSLLMQAEVDGEALTLPEQQSFFMLLEFAGNETTRNVIAGGMLALDENPEQKARLLLDPSRLPAAGEEMLRWTSPVSNFRRTATIDTELGGRTIREGDWVVLLYGSGNRDEDVFDEPDRFDVGRSPNPHLALGIGPHFCLGAWLGRLEIRVMFEELLRRFPDVQVTGPIERNRSNFVRGIARMPVELGADRG